MPHRKLLAGLSWWSWVNSRGPALQTGALCAHETAPSVVSAGGTLAAAVGAGARGQDALQQLALAVSRIAEACQGISAADVHPPVSLTGRVILPEFSEQEKSLRATLEKLVRFDERCSCSCLDVSHAGWCR